MRFFDPAMALGRSDGAGMGDVGPIARVGLPGVAMGQVVGIGLDPAQMLADQELALVRMRRAAALAVAGGAQAIGLGSLCAVVAGRGEALQAHVPVPVTTGAAATAWAMLENARTVIARVGGPVAIVGSAGPVGRALAVLLSAEGVDVRVDHKRGGRQLAVTVCDGPAAAVAGCPVVIGAGPTGGVLDPVALAPGAVLIDVALPGTLTGPPPRGVVVLAGEAVVCPPAWRRRFWGRLYQVFAGYGPRQVFACLIEPLVLVASGRTRPFALGRRLDPDDVAVFGAVATELGFRPRLARGWFGFDVADLPGAPRR
ncbi:MAG: hypothetical protein H6742_09395 [Alphaproteobacteria bacterium]|nr:hypothetical protein [Alphaproteobacteria bacterium]